MIQDDTMLKVDILFRQEKFVEAEQLIATLLSEEPNNAHYLFLLAEANLQQDKNEEALDLIEQAIGLEPDVAHFFHSKSRVYIQMLSYQQAEETIQQAIKIDPYDADYFALWAHIRLIRKQYEEALDTANKALEINAENLLALNTRSTALTKLNRSDEAYATIEGALREDPNNAYTHANFGWSLMENGDHKKALEHFKMALSHDPGNEYAQSGMVEALKATNFIYRIFLKYFLFMEKLTAKNQWAVIIGLYLSIKVLGRIANSVESLQPILTPVIAVIIMLAFSTWIISPLSNLLFRFNKYGQLLLSKEEKISSNFVAVSLGVFLIGLVLYLSTFDERMLPIAVYGLAMMVPLGVMFSSEKKRNILVLSTIVLALLGIGVIGLTFSTGKVFNLLTPPFILGFVAFQWGSNYILIKESNH